MWRAALRFLLAARLRAEGADFLLAELEGCPSEVAGPDKLRFRIERLAPFLDDLLEKGVGRAVFAGAVRRPRLDPELFDAGTAALVPRLLAAMQAGDDAALRGVIAIFEQWDIEVVGVDAVIPDLVPGQGLRLGGARLAALSACETGMVGGALPDEVMPPEGSVDAGEALTCF